jgi:hypothetical protein
MLLDCLHHFSVSMDSSYAALMGKSVVLYPVQEDKIHQGSIRYSNDSMESWTRACKCMLTQLQHLCLVFQTKEEEEQKRQHGSDPMIAGLRSMK